MKINTAELWGRKRTLDISKHEVKIATPSAPLVARALRMLQSRPTGKLNVSHLSERLELRDLLETTRDFDQMRAQVGNPP